MAENKILQELKEQSKKEIQELEEKIKKECKELLNLSDAMLEKYGGKTDEEKKAFANDIAEVLKVSGEYGSDKTILLLMKQANKAVQKETLE